MAKNHFPKVFARTLLCYSLKDNILRENIHQKCKDVELPNKNTSFRHTQDVENSITKE